MEDVLIRFVSALVASLLSVWCFFHGGAWIYIWWFFVYGCIIIEFIRVLEIKSPFMIFLHLLSSVIIFLSLIGPRNQIPVEVVFLPFIAALYDPENFVRITAVHSLSHLWIAYPCTLGLQYSSNVGFMVGFLCIVWFTDAGAYFCGKLFGRTPLLVNISPKKTVEGTFGAIVVALIVSHIVSIFVLSISRFDWYMIGFIASIFGQLGDLFESMFKRSYKLKDTGGIMPGHGGFLDRFDAVLFALVFTKTYFAIRDISIV